MRSSDQIREIAQGAKTLLADPLVQEVLRDLFKAAQSELLSAPIGGLTAVAAHAKMCALRDVQNGLEAFVTDAKVFLKEGKD